jgi:hypothetical protein
MKVSRFLVFCCFVSFSLFMVACDGGSGSSGSSDSSGSGVVAMSVTDAKPLLPENVTNLFVEFSSVWVHKPGEGWIELDLVESPYSIDLLQFYDGQTTELVPPVVLSSGKYTQVRIVVSAAAMRFDNGDGTDVTIDIPSENLKTDKNFTIDLEDDSAMDIIVHFDLSMSVVVSGPASDPTYKLKPVLHLFEDPVQAATIEGELDNSSFGNSEEKATIIVESNGEVYTQVEVSQSTDGPTIYSIFWIVPNQEYTVKIDIDQDDTIDCEYSIGDGGDFESPSPGEIVDIGICPE